MGELAVKQPVIFTDPKGNDHDALVTCVWGPTCVNVVFVSDDETRQDSFGRQIERQTSVPHVSTAGAHGNYFRLPGEERKEYVEPQSV